MIRQRRPIRRSDSAGTVTLVVLFALFVGCGEGRPETVEEAAAEINDEESGLVQSVDRPDARVTAKYLSPTYLALSDAGDDADAQTIDSLEVLYRNSLCFHVTSAKVGATVENGSDGSAGLPINGIVDVDGLKEMFRLELGERSLIPTVVIPETQAGDASQSWMVLFAVDHETDLRPMKSIDLVYFEPEQHIQSRFTYRVSDLIQSDNSPLN